MTFNHNSFNLTVHSSPLKHCLNSRSTYLLVQEFRAVDVQTPMMLSISMTCHPCWLKDELDSSFLTLTAVDKRLSCQPIVLTPAVMFTVSAVLKKASQALKTTSNGVLHEHFLAQSEQLQLFHIRQCCICVFVCAALPGLKLEKGEVTYLCTNHSRAIFERGGCSLMFPGGYRSNLIKLHKISFVLNF